jgi:MFS transporter, DHA3 family, macrolide efflux protein
MREVLRLQLMRRLWLAQLISQLGDVIALTTVIQVITFNLKATGRQVTFLQVYYLLPIVVLGVSVGVLIDRWRHKATMICSDLIRAALCMLLPFATHLWHFYSLMALISAVSAFYIPAQSVSVRASIPLQGLRAASSLMRTAMFIMRAVGPALASVLATTVGAWLCYDIDAATFIASACLIFSVTIHEAAGKEAVKPTGRPLAAALSETMEGFRFIAGNRLLLYTLLALAAGMFVVGCFGPLLAVYVRDSLHAPVLFVGVDSAIIAAGVLLGIGILDAKLQTVSDAKLVYFGLIGLAAGLAGLALFVSVWGAMLFSAVIGLAVAAIIVPAQSLIQAATPTKLLGRVGSSSLSIIYGAQLGGLMLSAVLVQSFGVLKVFLFCTCFLGVLVAVARVAGYGTSKLTAEEGFA